MTRLRISSQLLPGEHRSAWRTGFQPMTGPLLERRFLRNFPFNAFIYHTYTTAGRNLQGGICPPPGENGEKPEEGRLSLLRRGRYGAQPQRAFISSG